MPSPGDWIELAYGYDRGEVKLLAEAELARLGINPGDLDDEQIRLDIGTDTDERDFYRVSIRRSLLPAGDQPT